MTEKQSTKPEEVKSSLIDHYEDHLNHDDRTKGHWESRWCESARRKIRLEAFYVGVVFALTLLSLVLTWRGTAFYYISYNCQSCAISNFEQFAYLFLGGVLGGTMFGIKYLYKVVARGYWHEDRVLWRIFSPFLAGGSAVAIGGLLDSGLIGVNTNASTTSFYFSLGFISGYFADSALAKMQEIADTIFGAAGQREQKSSS
jgi:hypothetical protein